MAKNPQYLRLTDGIAVHGNQHDLASGFGISGFDVVAWPENPAAQKFCKRMLNKGIFEAAGKAEYDEVQASNPDIAEVPKVIMLKPGQVIPEYELRKNIETSGQKVAKRVAGRLQERDEDEEEGLLADDPNNVDDEELAGDAQRPTRREKVKAKQAKPGKKSKSKTKSRPTAVEEDDDEVEEDDDETNEDDESGDQGGQ